MTTTKSRPPVVDEHGVEHRHGCGLPGWVDPRPGPRGWVLVTCAGCQAVRLVQRGAAR